MAAAGNPTGCAHDATEQKNFLNIHERRVLQLGPMVGKGRGGVRGLLALPPRLFWYFMNSSAWLRSCGEREHKICVIPVVVCARMHLVGLLLEILGESVERHSVAVEVGEQGVVSIRRGEFNIDVIIERLNKYVLRRENRNNSFR